MKSPAFSSSLSFFSPQKSGIYQILAAGSEIQGPIIGPYFTLCPRLIRRGCSVLAQCCDFSKVELYSEALRSYWSKAQHIFNLSWKSENLFCRKVFQGALELILKVEPPPPLRQKSGSWFGNQRGMETRSCCLLL